MATLSVLNYNNLSAGLNMKVNNQTASPSGAMNASAMSKTFNKITVQNVLSENNGNSLNINNGNNPNAIVRKIKDFGMIGSVNNASGAAILSMNPRKRPLTETKQQQKPTESKQAASASKKPKLTKEERAAIRLAKKAAKENSSLAKTNTNATVEPLALLQKTKIPGTPGRKGLPLPQAVARRNARERNRVKQVNNGFAALREHIPEEVAEVFETQSTNAGNRGSCKKFSKVDTLRMAVEYIRSLERLLGFDFPVGAGQHNSSSGEESFSLIKDEFSAYSPTMDEHYDDSMSHYDNEEFFSANTSQQQQTLLPSLSPQPPVHMDSLPNITTLNGLQYIRIPGTNTYQLLTPDIFVGTASSPPSSTVDEEHFNALIDTNCVSPSSSSTPNIMQQQQTTIADHQSPSPPSINSTTDLIRRVPVTAPVVTKATNAANINEGSATLSSSSSSPSATLSSSSSSLLLSPVLQNQQQQIIPLLTATASSPSTSPVLHQQQQQLHALSPATTNDQHQQQQQLHQGLRQTCATNQLQQQQQFLLPNSTGQQIGTLHMIKQEYEEPSSNIYQQTSPNQQQQQQQHLQLYHSAMSPPLERQTPTTSTSANSSHMLQQFFTQEQHTSSFYEGIVTMKKELNEVLLDASHGTAVMSDESMIEAIDWWDAHTPKSDGGSLMM